VRNDEPSEFVVGGLNGVVVLIDSDIGPPQAPARTARRRKAARLVRFDRPLIDSTSDLNVPKTSRRLARFQPTRGKARVRVGGLTAGPRCGRVEGVLELLLGHNGDDVAVSIDELERAVRQLVHNRVRTLERTFCEDVLVWIKNHHPA